MSNFKITFSAGHKSNPIQTMDFIKQQNGKGWDVSFMGFKTGFSVVPYYDMGGGYYDVTLEGNPVKHFAFEKDGLSVPSNLFEIASFIMRKGNN